MAEGFGGSFSLASAYVELKVKGNLGQQIKAQQAGVSAALNSVSASAAKTSTGISSIITKLYKVREAMDQIKKSSLDAAKGITNKAAVGFAAGTASMTASVAAASPVAFDTLTGSIKLLTGEIGMMFIPAIVEVSKWLQDAANFIHSLSDETKSTIAGIALWTVGIMGAVAVIGRLVIAGMTLFSGLTSLGVSSTVAAVSVTTLGLAAAAVAIILFDLAKRHGELAKMKAEQMKYESGILDKEDMESEIIKKIKSARPEDQLKVAQQEQTKATEAMNKAQETYDKESSNPSRFHPPWEGQSKNLRELAMPLDEIAELRRNHGRAYAAIKSIQQTGSVQVGGGVGMATARQQPPVTIGDIASARQRVMQAGLGQSSLEAQLLKMQRDGNAIAEQQFGEVQKINGKIPDIGLGK